MQFSTSHGSYDQLNADVFIVPFLADGDPGLAGRDVNWELDGYLSALYNDGDITGKANEITTLHLDRPGRVSRFIVVGIGEADDLASEVVRAAFAKAVAKAKTMPVRTAALFVPNGDYAAAVTEGAALATYSFDQYKKEEEHTLAECIVVGASGEGLREGVARGEAYAKAITAARDLVNRPPNDLTPEALAEFARSLSGSDNNVSVQVHDETWAEEQGMGAFLAVARGASTKPRFIEVHYRGRSSGKPYVLVGKGVTFDSGGLSLKTGAGMMTMKGDMAGAATVLAAVQAAAALRLQINVTALVPALENMPDGNAFRPGDVVKARNDVTIEVLNTDAEGRLALADALSYASTFEPQAVIDVATLTGAVARALGRGVAAGLFGNDDGLITELEVAAIDAGEQVWELPIFPQHRKEIRGSISDIKNIGSATGGASSAAAFLEHFIDYDWAHLDVAGMTFSDTASNAYTPAGATGYGVRTLIEFLRSKAGRI